MKKLLILTAALVLTGTQVFATETCPIKQGPCPIDKMEAPAPGIWAPPCKRMHKPPFDIQKISEDLNLNKKQQESLKQLHDKEVEAIKPLKEQIKVKNQQIEEICNERLTVKERQEKLAPVHKEIRELRKQIHDIRMQGKKDFEALLTDKQVKKLQQLKEERRKEFRARHHRGEMHRRPPMPPCNCIKPVQPPVVEECAE